MPDRIPLNKIKIEYRHPSQLKGAIFEPEKRLYEDLSFRALVDWIRREGILEPIAITPDGTIIDGHRRHAAAVYLNMQEVPCNVLSVGLQIGFAAMNGAQKAMTGAQWLDAHARGMDLAYIRTKEAKQIRWLEESVGENGIKRLAAYGKSPEIAAAAKRLSVHLGWNQPNEIAAIIWWMVEQGMQRPAIDALKTEPPTPARVFADAIRRKKPLQQFWGVASDLDSDDEDDD